MASINKNFVIKNGLEVDSKTLYVDANTNRVGIGSTIPTRDLDVVGDVAVQGTITTPSIVVGVATAGTVGVSTLTATSITGTAATITSVTCQSFTVVGSSAIGNGAEDEIALNGEITTNIIPDVDSILDFGYFNRRWRDIHLGRNINASTLVGFGLSVGVGTARSYVAKELVISGFSTFTSGPVVVGSGTSTGTVLQPLQVTGGAYVSGSVGLGTTNPTSKLHVIGDTLITGVSTATAFNGNINAGVGTITSVTGTTATYTNGDFAVLDGDVFFSNTGIITSLTGAKAKYTTLDGDVFFSNTGIVTSLTGTKAKYTTVDGNTLFSNTGIVTTISGTTATYTNGDFAVLDGNSLFSNTGIVTSLTGTKAKYTTLDGDVFFSNTGIVTSLTGTKAKYTTVDGDTFFSNTGIVTSLTGTTATYTNGDFAVLDGNSLFSNTGIVTTISGTTATYTNGDFAVLDGNTLFSNTGIVTSLTGTTAKYTTLDGDVFFSNTGIVTTISGTTATYTNGDFAVLDGNTLFSNTGIVTSLTGTKATYTNGDFAVLDGNALFSNTGIITSLTGAKAKYTTLDGDTFFSNTGIVTTISGTKAKYTTLDGDTFFSNTGIVTTISGTTATYTNGDFAVLDGNSLFSNTGIVTSLTGTNLNFSGLSTVSLLTGTTANFIGVGTFGSLSIGATSVISSDRQLQNIASLDSTTLSVIAAGVAASPNNFVNLTVIGISTFINGPILVGSVTPTGTASQSLQVTGGAYVSGNTGIGITNPTSKLHVIGNTLVSGVSTATTFNGNINAGVGTITSVTGTTATYTNGDFAVLDGDVFFSNTGIVTTISGTTATYTNGDFAVLDGNSLFSNTGIVTTISGTTAKYTTLDGNTLFSNTGIVTSLTGTKAKYTTLDGDVFFSNTGIVTTISGTTATYTTLELGNATDTTISRVSAGRIAVEGVNVVTTSSTDTLTNKTLTSPTLTTPVLGAATATSIVVGSGVTINASGINAGVGIITATKFSTGADGAAINIEATRITGPTELIIDPQNIADNTGRVRIKGDLFVDGSQFVVNSGTIELADFVVGIATTVTSNAVLDGAGIAIGNSSITSKTLTYSFGSSALKSSENFDLLTGKTYKINGTDVLSSTTLGSAVLNSSLTSVGTLTALTVSGTLNASTTLQIGGVSVTSTAAELNLVDGSVAGTIVNSKAVIYGAAGQVGVAAGSAANPGVFFSGDTNTGIYSPGADQLAVATNGTGRLFVGSTGAIGVNEANPTALLHIAGTTTAGGIKIVDSSSSFAAPGIEVIGKRSDGNGSSAFAGKLLLSKNRTDAAISSNSVLGSVAFGGNHTDGTEANILYSASIAGISDGAFNSATDMPTALVFNTGATGRAPDTANVTTGTERLRITSAGLMGLGTNAPTAQLHVVNVGANDSFIVEDSGSDTTPFRIGAGGEVFTGSKLVVGAQETYNDGAGAVGIVQINGAGLNNSRTFSHIHWGGNPRFRHCATPSTTLGTHTISVLGGGIGAHEFYASDGVSFIPSASIQSTVDATPSVGVVPGNLTFSTAPAGTLTERLRITSAGLVGIGTNAPSTALQVVGTVTATTFAGALTGTASNVTTNANLTGDVTSVGNATAIATGVIVNADINASAAIALSKLATGALPTAITIASGNIVNGTIIDNDISASAAIGLSKLADGALPTSITIASGNIVNSTIVNNDISASAAIGLAKLATGALPSGITVASANIVNSTIVNDDISASAAIADTKLATISTAGKVSGTAITSGNIATSGSMEIVNTSPAFRLTESDGTSTHSQTLFFRNADQFSIQTRDSTGTLVSSDYLIPADASGATDHIWRIANTEKARLNSGGLTVVDDLTISDKIIHAGDTDTAIRFPAADTVTVETDGVTRVRVHSDGNLSIGSATNTGDKLYVNGTIRTSGQIQTLQGDTDTAPGYTWQGDEDTGMFRTGANSLGFSAGGQEIARFNLDGTANRRQLYFEAGAEIWANGSLFLEAVANVRSVTIRDSTTASAGNVFINTSAGSLLRSTSSVKYKTEVEDAELSYSETIIYGSRPVWYRSLSENDPSEYSYWGFIAEEVAEIDPRMVHWGDDGPEGVQYDRYVVHLVSVIQKQQQRLDALEARLTAAGI
jgi:hypothetical protein